MRRASSFAMVSLLLVGLAFADRAHAEPRDPPAAEALFTSAREAMAAGRFDVACSKLTESYRLDPAPGTLLNLAACEEKRGRLADAWQRYRELAQALPPSDDRLPFVKKQVESLAKRVPRLSIRLGAGAPEATTITRDGIEVGKASQGERLPVNPGEIVLLVSAPGFRTRTLTISLLEGEQRDVDVLPGERLPSSAAPPEVPPSASPPAPVPPSPPSSAPPPAPEPVGAARSWGHALAGGGIAALALGLTAGAFAIGRRTVVRSHCDEGQRCDDEGLKASGDYRTLATMSTVAFAVGVVGLGAGGYLLLTGSPGRSGQVALGGRF